MNNKQIKRYFKLAKEISNLSEYEDNKFGVVIVYKKHILSIGYNKKISNPMQKKYNKYRSANDRFYDVNKQNNYIHAEINAIQRITSRFNGDYNKCSIFVYRETKSGKKSLAKPCNACMKCLKDIGIKNLYYTTENGYNYEIIS